ncbi:hypothetical protein MHPYR_50105 [uncultured Mycobacterium sp.]|uniref:Uncharacterized protein n=1 Tax=uncultured Mycobacterium sp. TaxID=171292 RepID=A0A1Y5PPV5_9MYCO|nr:hypothetical protein MHPYR_50105 [uncultured Mycobacterium sp.]
MAAAGGAATPTASAMQKKSTEPIRLVRLMAVIVAWLRDRCGSEAVTLRSQMCAAWVTILDVRVEALWR